MLNIKLCISTRLKLVLEQSIFISVLESGGRVLLCGGASTSHSTHEAPHCSTMDWSWPITRARFLFGFIWLRGGGSKHNTSMGRLTQSPGPSVVFEACWWTAVFVVLITLHLASVVVSDDQLPGSGYVEVPCCTHHFRHQKGNDNELGSLVPLLRLFLPVGAAKRMRQRCDFDPCLCIYCTSFPPPEKTWNGGVLYAIWVYITSASCI